ncbi:Transposon Tf2-11 polyprotein [Thelohanellus kitauei]|uniref:Transposon Tf2-11 polyprotein n=1 Tax=Thelohanellus kitauei TaxID=669202 RepID=A0A0C2IVX7_THEKT|nr:Transposon Tf2-11 polyprotein [Thelohanellus kitauei]
MRALAYHKFHSYLEKLLSAHINLSKVTQGTTNRISHNIGLTGDNVCRKPSRTVPAHCRQMVVGGNQTNLLEKDIIAKSSSPYCASVVFVPKKKGDGRICVDHRKLNKITKRNAFPIPLLSDVQNKLKGFRVFSKIDL